MKTYNITKLLTTLCACACITFAMAQANPDQLELVNFYNNNCKADCDLNWGDPNIPFENWDGILVNPDGTVYDINLPNKGLTGTIPDFNLPALTRLILNDNDLEGTIPNFSGIPLLYSLALYNNRLDGAIPDLIHLNALTWINLSNNQLSGVIPDLSHMTQLTTIGLNGNELNGEIPDFNTLVNLEYLVLENNQLSGNVPDFSNLTQLKQLGLKSNELVGNIPEFSTLTNLEILNIGDNQLTGSIPDFSTLTMLQSIHLQSNGLSGTIPNFNNLDKLTHLSLNQNRLTGSVPDFANSPNLKSLYLSSNRLSGTVPDFSRVDRLYIHRNEFSYEDIAANFDANNTVTNFSYINQYIGDPQFYTKNEGDFLELSPDPVIPYPNPVVGWIKDGAYSVIPAANNTTFTINSMAMDDIGIYRYYFDINSTDTPDLTIKFTSRQIYVYIDGYDLSGAPAIPGQLILDYGTDKDLIAIDNLRNELTTTYGGTLLKSCGCSVEVDLWQFPPDMMDSVREDLDIDSGNEKRTDASDIDSGNEKRTDASDIDGGQNIITQQQLTYMPADGQQLSVSFPSINTGQGSVVIGVLDTGLDIAHPDIIPNVWNNPETSGNNDGQNCYTNDTHGYNFVHNNGSIQDTLGHGTHVGGVIAANVPAGLDVKVMPVKAFDSEGNGTMYDMICGIHYAMDNGADIINISAGYEGHKAPVFQKTIQYGREKDIIFVVSAGNKSLDLDETGYWPASFAGDTLLTNTMITVTSVDATYQLSDNVGYGDTTVTVAAHGEGVFSPAIGGGYAHFTGTSISTPLVALALGIEKTQNTDRDYTTLRSDFLGSLDTISTLTNYVENGRVLTMGIDNLPHIIINPKDQCVGIEAGTSHCSVFSDVDFEVSTDVDWLTVVPLDDTEDDIILELNYLENPSTESRVATIFATSGAIIGKGYLIQEGTSLDPTDLAINEAFINGIIYKAATNTITADNIIEDGATVRYSAGTSIVMSEGFHAEPGSSFLANIGVCEQPDNREEQLIPQISLRSYPNPFSAQTTIEYSLLEDSEITLIISDVAGRHITTLVNGETKTAGTHKVVFDGSQLPSGMYYYTIKTSDYFGTQKIILAK